MTAVTFVAKTCGHK